MSQSGYFEVKAVSDCVVCKTRGFNECHPRWHPQFHNVLDCNIITISHRITRSGNMKKDRTAPQSNIHTKKHVCVRVWYSAGKTYVFSWLNDAWSTCQLASVLITVTQKNWDTRWTDKEEKTMKVRKSKSKRKLHFLLPYRPPHMSSWPILSVQQDHGSGHNNVLH